MTTDLRAQIQSALGAAYTVDREIGGGGMSRVFLAEDAALRRRIVVKLLPRELSGEVSVARFQREIAFAARLQHPHIVPLLSYGDTQGLPYYTMPFVEGESLRHRLVRSGELPVVEALRILREIATALAYAHEMGIVHRDIKPENVLLSGGTALVADFGVAKAIISSTEADGPLTSTGIAIGTPAYMAPEQIVADPGVDHRADLYAFGMIAYEMLDGRPPFAGRRGQSLISAHVIDAPEPIDKRRPAIPPALAALIMRCLEKRPADRPQDANEIVAVLDALMTPTRTDATSAASFPAKAAAITGRRWISATSIGALALLGVVAAGAAWQLFAHRTPAVASAPRLLVEPFENVTNDHEMDYVGRLAADQLTMAVAQVGSMDVVPSSDMLLALRDSAHSATEQLKRLSEAMNVSLLLTGTFAHVGDSLVFNAQVKELRSGTVVQTLPQSVSRASDPLAAVNSLGDHLVGWLGMRKITALPQRGFRAPTSAAQLEFEKAYELIFLRGRPREARPFLERAIALDSSYARAYLALFPTFYYADERASAESVLIRVERLPQRLSVGEQALLDLDRSVLRGDLNGQLGAQLRLAALDSNVSSLTGVGEVANSLLRPDLAVPALERVYAAASVVGGQEASSAAWALGEAYHQAGAPERELRMVRSQRAKDHDMGALAGRQLRAFALLGQGGTAAVALADSMLRSTSDPTGNVLIFVGWGVSEFRAHGDTATASQLLKMVRSWMATHPTPPANPARAYRDGVILLASRMPDSAAVRFASAGGYENGPADVVGYLALASVARGDRARGRAIADSLGHVMPTTAQDEFWRAAILGALGDRAEAVQLLRKANGDGQSMTSWHHYLGLESLHGFPEFDALVRPRR